MEYMCLVGYKLPQVDGYLAVCLVLTIEDLASSDVLVPWSSFRDGICPVENQL